MYLPVGPSATVRHVRLRPLSMSALRSDGAGRAVNQNALPAHMGRSDAQRPQGCLHGPYADFALFFLKEKTTIPIGIVYITYVFWARSAYAQIQFSTLLRKCNPISPFSANFVEPHNSRHFFCGIGQEKSGHAPRRMP